MDDLPPSLSQSQSLCTKQFEFIVISSVSLGLKKESEENRRTSFKDQAIRAEN